MTLVWALSPLVYGLSAGPCFAWAAWRLRRRALAAEALVYVAAVTVMWMALAGRRGADGTAAAVIVVGLIVVACARAFAVRRQLLGSFAAETAPASAMAYSSARNDTAWAPVFPAQKLREEDRALGLNCACDGHDRHQLSMALGRAAPVGVGGALLIGVDVWMHVYERALGLGIGMLVVPLLAVLVAQWVDGPVLYYRRWGRLHRLALSSVRTVATSKRTARQQTLILAAPGLPKPVRVSLHHRGYVMTTAARAHLHGWLSAPHVQWTADAIAALDPNVETRSSTRHHRLLAPVVGAALSLAGAGIGVWVIIHGRPDLASPGAPGYFTFTGPRGKPLAVGRPWGAPCQPVRFAVEAHVPNWIYADVAAVVSEARSDGIDVAVENRQFYWSPTSLYYTAGQSPASTVRVAICATNATPPRLGDGRPEHVDLGWDARTDPDGTHEDLTVAQGVLELQALGNDLQAASRSVRQLIAMTQGIMSTSRHQSAIAHQSTSTHFAAADVAAMQHMSGCQAAADGAGGHTG